MARPISNPFARVLSDPQRSGQDFLRSARGAEEAELLDVALQSVERWAGEQVDAARIDAEGRIPAELRRSAAELGLFGLSIPSAYGGAGFSLAASCRVLTAIARHDPSMAVSVGLHNGAGVGALIAYGSEAQKREYLPALASGERIAAFAATEAEAGSDLSAVATTARPIGDDLFEIDGTKLYVTNGGFAGLFTLVARTPGLGSRDCYSLILVPRETPGLRVGAEEHKLGMRGSSTTPIHLDRARVPLDHVIGEPSRGLEKLDVAFSTGRLLLAAGCLGGARYAYERAIAHATRRVQFGQAIGRFGQVRQKIATMRAQLYAMESLLSLVGTLPRSGDPDLSWESLVTKVFCSDAIWSIADESLQIHGGSGFIEGTGVARLLRDARVTRIFEGTNEVLRFQLATRALLFPTEVEALEETLEPELRGLASGFDLARARIGARLGVLYDHYGSRIFEHQLLMRGMSSALISCYVLLAVLLRCDRDIRDGSPDASLAIARYLTLRLGRSIERGISSSLDEDEEKLVAEISEHEYAAA